MDCFWLRFHHKKTGCLIVQPTHLSRISSATWMINGWKNHTPQWRVESSSLSITKQCTPKTNHKLIKCYNGFFFGEKCVFLWRICWGVLKNPQTQRWDTPTILYWSRSRWVEAKRGVLWLSNPNSYPSNHTSGHTLSRRNEPRNKTGRIPSIESWLLNIGIRMSWLMK